MADAALGSTPLRTVQLESLVVMRIIKHCSTAHPTIATGSLVGMDVNGMLQVTNCFPFPTPDMTAQDARGEESAHNAAAAAPRAKANNAYQAQMVSMLRDVNIDANTVGWYTSTNMGNFFNIHTVENQYFYQKEMNERTVALVHDVARSAQGALSIRAFRLSPLFISAFKENKFSTEALQKSGLRYQDILQELPVTIHNSHLLTSLLHSSPGPAPPALNSNNGQQIPTSLSDLTRPQPSTSSVPHSSNFDILDLSIDPFLERSADLLLETLESHHVENNNAQYYQRSLAREQAKISAWQTKRKAENAARVAAKQAPLPEDEWTKLFKLPTEPSRLEMLLNSGQVEQVSKIVDGFAGTVSAKMFAVRGNLVRDGGDS